MLKVSPPLMLHNGSIYIPDMGDGGSNQSVSRHMEGQGSSYSLLNEKKIQIFFVFEHKTQCMWIVMVQVAYTRVA